jgi:hypothetical protein
MGDHHALRPRCRAAGVVDRQQIGFSNQWSVVPRRRLLEQRFVIQPVGPDAFGAKARERDEMTNVRQLGP